MPTHTLEDEVYHNYDFAVSATLTKLYKLAQNEGVIRLYWFERKYKSHLFVLRIALMARDLFNVPIILEGLSWWDTFQINRKIKKSFNKIHRGPSRSGGLAVPQLLEDLYSEIAEKTGFRPDFEMIYRAYYEGSLD